MMLVALGVLAVVKKADLAQTLAMMGEISAFALPIACAVVGFCLCMCPISAPSFSLEGKYLWLLKEAPVTERTLIAIKTWFQVAIALPCILIGCLCLSFALEMTAVQTLILLAFSVAFEIGHAYFGMLIGLIFARTDLDDAAILKRSLLSFLSTFGAMAALGLVGVASWQVWAHFDPAAGMASALGLVLLLSLTCGILLRAKGAALLRKL